MRCRTVMRTFTSDPRCNVVTAVSSDNGCMRVTTKKHVFFADDKLVGSAPCPKEYLCGALAACAAMTLQTCYDGSRERSVFKGTAIRGWSVIVMDYYKASDPSAITPTHFSMHIAAFTEPPLSLAQIARFERALRVCPVKNSLKQEVLVEICSSPLSPL